MKHAHSAMLLTSLILAAATAVGCKDDVTPTTSTATTADAGTPLLPTPPALPMADAMMAPASDAMPASADGTKTVLTDAQILQITHIANSGEVAQANMALGITKDSRVKSFAQMMVTDHGDADTKGAAIATKEGLTLTDSPTSTSLKSDGDKTMADLKGRTGVDFDKAYVDAQVKGHQDVLHAIDDVLMPNAKNTEVKAYLMAIRPKVAEHLKHALDLQSDLKKPS